MAAPVDLNRDWQPEQEHSVIVEQGSSMEARLTLGAGDLGPRYDDALIYAAAHHRHQMRKGCRVPYLAHLMSVSALVLEHGGSEVAAIGGLLHDAVEDAPRGEGPRVLAEIEGKFGAEVARIVRACSDGLDEAGNRSGTWVERKQPYLQALPPQDAGRATRDRRRQDAQCWVHRGRCSHLRRRVLGCVQRVPPPYPLVLRQRSAPLRAGDAGQHHHRVPSGCGRQIGQRCR